MAHWMAEEAAAQHAAGMSCSFDCYACEVRGRAHAHPCYVCAADVRCFEEHWDEDDLTPGLVRCDAHALPVPVPHGPWHETGWF